MLRLLLCLSVLGALIQPGVLFPKIEVFRPFFLIMGITLVAIQTSSYRKKIPGVLNSDQAIFIFGLLICESFGYFVTESGYISGTLLVLREWVILFFVFFILSVMVDSVSRARQMLWLMVIAGSYIFWEAFKILAYSPELMRDGRLGSYGMYEGANDFALILVLVFPIAFKLFYMEKTFVKKLFLLSVMLVIPYLLLFTVSRGGMLGFATVLTMAILLDDKSIKKSNLFSKVLKISPLLLVFFAIGYAKLAIRQDTQSFSMEDASAAHRIIAWKAGMRMMIDMPYGIGYGNFVDFSKKYGSGRIQAHNTLVKVGAEAGFLGLFCYISLIYSNFRHLLALYKNGLANHDRQAIFIVQALGISLVGFFLCTFFSVKEYEHLLYINLGLTCALTSIYDLPRRVFTARDAFIVVTIMFLFFVFVKMLPA